MCPKLGGKTTGAQNLVVFHRFNNIFWISEKASNLGKRQLAARHIYRVRRSCSVDFACGLFFSFFKPSHDTDSTSGPSRYWVKRQPGSSVRKHAHEIMPRISPYYARKKVLVSIFQRAGFDESAVCVTLVACPNFPRQWVAKEKQTTIVMNWHESQAKIVYAMPHNGESAGYKF